MSAGQGRELAELALALQHDVGKYITRVARNLPPGDVPAVLLDMLVADLYRTDGVASALDVYRRRLADSAVDEALVPPAIPGGLLALGALEARVRAHDPSAVREACALALAVDEACRAFVRALAEGA